MKKLFLLFGIIATVFLTNNTFAQRTCGAMHNHDLWLQSDPQYVAKRQAIEQHHVQYQATAKPTRAIVTIPVVVHVVWNTAAENISDSQIYAQINQLNLDFSRKNTDTSLIPTAFKAIAADCEVQFCLAVRDPNGQVTSGIQRRQTTVTSFNTNNNVKFFASGGLDAWPSGDYLNFWSCDLGTSLLGYAQFPGGAAATDGVVMNYNTVGSMLKPGTSTNYNLGRTATHEVGHWLDLFHIWGDDNGSCGGSDQVGDTPNQEDANAGCPNYPLTDACTVTNPGVMFMNYMDYVYDACMYMFSAGQKARMQALFAVGGDRYSLLSSQGCVPVLPCSGLPTAGTATGNPLLLGCADTSKITLTAFSTQPGITLQWETSSDSVTFTTITGATTNTLTVVNNNVAGKKYYRCKVLCTNSTQFAYCNVVTISTLGMSSVNGDTICAPGAVSLLAQGLGNFVWYSNNVGTNIIGTGATLNTSVTGDTTFYINTVSNNNYTIGAPNSAIGAGGNNNNFNNGLVFTTQQNLVVDTVHVYPSSTGNVVVILEDSSLNINADTAIFAITSAQVNTKVALPVNFMCTAGKIYKITPTTSTVGNLYRNTSGYTFPFTINGVMSIIGPAITTNNRYAYFYDWKITSGCATNLQPVFVDVQGANIISTTTNVLCNNTSTGSINANIPGSTYTFTLNGNANNTTGIFNNLPAGNYNVTAINAIGCTGSTTVTLLNPAAIALTTLVTNPTSGNNGSISATVTGGSGSIVLLINGTPTTSTIPNLAPGIFTITAIDANGCSTNNVVTLFNNNVVTLVVNSVTNMCNNVTGNIATSAIGGATPYTFTLNGATSQGNGNYSNLAAGLYTVQVADINGITAATTLNIGSSNITLTSINTIASYGSLCDGIIDVAAIGGVAPYMYNINGSGFNVVGTFANLCSGTYTICAKDALECVTCNVYTVNIASPIAVSTFASTLPCSGTATGSITMAATGGIGTLTYSINGGSYQTSNVFNNLASGTYTVITQDAYNHTESVVVTLNSITANVAATFIAPLCNGNANGTITASTASTNAPFTYSLNGGTVQTAPVFNNVAVGNYTLAIVDGNGCNSNTTITVTAPSTLQYTIINNPVKCFGQSNGSIVMNNTGGVAPYIYSINGGAYGSSNTFGSLIAGAYSVVTQDANGCTNSSVVNVLQAASVLSAGATSTNASGGNNGSINAIATGGATPYVYSINGITFNTSPAFNGLGINTYTVTIKDGYGCTATTKIVISFPESINNITVLNNVELYPNPTSGIVQLTTTNMAVTMDITIHAYDAVGKLINQYQWNTSAAKTLQINATAWSKGIYHLVLTDKAGNKQVRKIVKQ